MSARSRSQPWWGPRRPPEPIPLEHGRFARDARRAREIDREAPPVVDLDADPAAFAFEELGGVRFNPSFLGPPDPAAAAQSVAEAIEELWRRLASPERFYLDRSPGWPWPPRKL